MPNRLQGKVAFVTGGAQGIGAAISQLFAAEGAMVAIGDLLLGAESFRAEILQQEMGGPPHMAGALDITSKDSIQQMVSAILAQHGRIDILINNAGANFFKDPLKLTEAEWQSCLAVDLQGAWLCSQAVLPIMLKQGSGSIVNIASVHGHKIIPHSFPYPVAKHGLIGLTKALGVEYAAQGIRVNSISPGLILTKAAEDYFLSFPDPEAIREKERLLLPCKRIGTPIEVAQTALFLASDEAPFINAADILIDGGLSALYHG